MRKFTVLFLVLLVAAAIGLYAYSRYSGEKRHEIRAVFTDDHGKKAEVVFFFAEKPMADLSLSDGRTYILSQGLSASGARYVNPDESFVLWIKGDTAFIEENGIRTFDGCALKK